MLGSCIDLFGSSLTSIKVYHVSANFASESRNLFKKIVPSAINTENAEHGSQHRSHTS